MYLQNCFCLEHVQYNNPLRECQRVTKISKTNDKKWQRVVISAKHIFFQIKWGWYEYLKNEVISLRQRCFQAVVIDIFNVDIDRYTPVLFLKLSTCYFLHTGKRGLKALDRRLRTLNQTLRLKTLKRTLLLDTLRFYATFKVSKFESFFCKVNTCSRKTMTCIGLQAEQIFSVNI